MLRERKLLDMKGHSSVSLTEVLTATGRQCSVSPLKKLILNRNKMRVRRVWGINSKSARDGLLVILPSVIDEQPTGETKGWPHMLRW